MARELSIPAQAAKAVRQWLKAEGIPARVTSESYSMGSSLNVYLDDARPELYKKVDEFADQYQYGDFNGMEDIYEYRKGRPQLPQVKFVFVNNNASDAIRQEIWDFARNYFNVLVDAPANVNDVFCYQISNWNMTGSQLVWRLYSGAEMAYWNYVDQQVAEVA